MRAVRGRKAKTRKLPAPTMAQDAPRVVTPAGTKEAFNRAVAKKDYCAAIAEVDWIRAAKKFGPTYDGQHRLAARIIERRFPGRLAIARMIQNSVFFGEEIHPVVLLYVADLLEGKKFGRPRLRKSEQALNDVSLIERICEFYDVALTAGAKTKEAGLREAFKLAAKSGLANGNVESVKRAYRAAVRRRQPRG
jgi:hypothetical protein